MREPLKRRDFMKLGGTALALIPNAPAPVRAPAARLVGREAVPAVPGD